MQSLTRRLLALSSSVALIAACAMVGAPAAHAISSDYCGQWRAPGDPFCFEGSGYRGWRYHQASTGGWPLVNLCVRAHTGSYYRVNACSGSSVSLIFRQYCDAEPTTNSSVGWQGSGSVVIYGHADSRTCDSFTGGFDTSLDEQSRAAGAGAITGPATTIARGRIGTLYAAGAERGRCVVLVTRDGRSGACATDAGLAAQAGRLLVSEALAGGGHVVYGIVGGDGATAVVRSRGGAAAKASAVSAAGGVIAESAGEPAEIVVSTAAGSATQPLPSLGQRPAVTRTGLVRL